jgi:hypothetical protein
LLGTFFGTALFAGAVARCEPPSSTDNQLWDETRLVYKLNSEVNVFAAGAFRLTDDFSEFGRASGRCGVGWQPMPSFTLMPSYLYSVDDPASASSKAESRLCLLMSYRIPVETATLSLINTTEYRMPEGVPATWRLRPKLELSHPLGPDSLDLSGYLANELFYDEGKNAWSMDRVFAGLKKNVGSNTDVELYYCRELRMSGTNPDINVIGINVRFTFGPQAVATPDEPDTQ